MITPPREITDPIQIATHTPNKKTPINRDRQGHLTTITIPLAPVIGPTIQEAQVVLEVQGVHRRDHPVAVEGNL